MSCPVCNVGNSINFRLGTVKSERVNGHDERDINYLSRFNTCALLMLRTEKHNDFPKHKSIL